MSGNASFIATFSSLYQLPSELTTERNSSKTDHISGIECDLNCVSRIWGILSLENPGSVAFYFRRFSTTSQLNGKFNGQYRRNETWQTIGEGHWKLQVVPCTAPELH